jgi:hypothetical protein
MAKEVKTIYNTGGNYDKEIDKIPCTLCVDTLVLSFTPPTKHFDNELKDKLIAVDDLTYTVVANSFNHSFQSSVIFYEGDRKIATIAIQRKVRGYNSKLLMRVSKECMYVLPDWRDKIERLIQMLGIKEYTIERLDVALDMQADILGKFHKYYSSSKYRSLSKAKYPNQIFDKDNKLISVRYSIDMDRKVISIYQKLDRQHYHQGEDAVVKYASKMPNDFQIEYWRRSGLNADTIARAEVRLRSKYIKDVNVKLSDLTNRDLLLALYKRSIGYNLTFVKKDAKETNVTRQKHYKVIDWDRLNINEVVPDFVLVKVTAFELSDERRTLLKMMFQTKKFKLVQAIDAYSAIYEIDHKLRVKIWDNGDGLRGYETLYTDAVWEKHHPPRVWSQAEIDMEEYISKNGLDTTYPEE